MPQVASDAPAPGAAGREAGEARGQQAFWVKERQLTCDLIGYIVAFDLALIWRSFNFHLELPMLTVADLLLDPMTREELVAKQREASFDSSPAAKVLMWAPPIFDLVGCAIVAGVDYAIRGDRSAPWETAWGAVNRDWSQSTVAHRYVEKVRAQNRELVKAEVTALEDCLQMSNMASAAASAAVDAATEAASQAVEKAVADGAQALRDAVFGAGAPKKNETPR